MTPHSPFNTLTQQNIADIGNDYCGVMRKWIQQKFMNGDTVIWGSYDELKLQSYLTPSDLEFLAARIAIAAVNEYKAKISAKERLKSDLPTAADTQPEVDVFQFWFVKIKTKPHSDSVHTVQVDTLTHDLVWLCFEEEDEPQRFNRSDVEFLSIADEWED